MDRNELRAAATPTAIEAALRAGGPELVATGEHAGHGGFSSLRTASYKGHEIVVRTTYEITVDGRAFEAPLTVDNGGRVHYHGLPTRDFTSAIALVKKAIDTFPDDFADQDDDQHDDQHHDHGDAGSHGSHH